MESTVEILNVKGKTFAVEGVCIFCISIEACFGIVEFDFDMIESVELVIIVQRTSKSLDSHNVSDDTINPDGTYKIILLKLLFT